MIYKGKIARRRREKIEIWGRKNTIYKGKWPAAGEQFLRIWDRKTTIYKGYDHQSYTGVLKLRTPPYVKNEFQTFWEFL